MKNITTRKIVLFSIGLFSALMLLIGLSFSMIYVPLDPMIKAEIFEEVGGICKFYESGFNMLGFGFSLFLREFSITLSKDISKIANYETFFGLTSLFTLILALTSICLLVYAFFMKNQEKAEKIIKILIIISVIMTVFHAIFPIIFSADMNSFIASNRELVEMGFANYIKVKTAAFVPLIIQIISLVAYIFCSKQIEKE